MLLKKLILVANCVAQTTFNNAVRLFIERTRARFQCGFQEIGIPTLDPLVISSYNVFLQDIDIAQK